MRQRKTKRKRKTTIAHLPQARSFRRDGRFAQLLRFAGVLQRQHGSDVHWKSLQKATKRQDFSQKNGDRKIGCGPNRRDTRARREKLKRKGAKTRRTQRAAP